mgnify:CR=1 FL=1
MVTTSPTSKTAIMVLSKSVGDHSPKEPIIMQTSKLQTKPTVVGKGKIVVTNDTQ